ncbi:MAG TPA: protein kinase, partial [Blastocatellia bacterium]|nr:protein kinase [Blastocatellia bacterium]
EAGASDSRSGGAVMIGNVLGNYKITEKIGEGGMGSVFRGIDMMLEREVAIKMLKPELAGQPHIVERFRTEAVTLARLNHPNIATLYTFMRQGNDFFMVMEFVRGETLDSVIRRTGAIECNRAVMLFCQALEGIDYAHRLGIIHRDIKPANMMLTQEGAIKVMDFGIARVLGSARMTREGHVVGTIEYMSPEQVRGNETDARSDIYSLGILLYEILTGKVPFTSTSEFDLMRAQIEEAPPPPRTFAAHIPLSIEQAIMRSLAKRADARYQTAGEFRAALLGAAGVSANLNASNLAARLAPQINNPNYPPTQLASAEALKETRLAGDQSRSAWPTGGYAAPLAPGANQVKETRLPWQGGPHPTGAHFPAQPMQPHMPVNQTPASFFDKLKWQHYAAAGTAAVVVICASIGFMNSGGKQPPLTDQKNSNLPSFSGGSGQPAPPPPTPSENTITPIEPVSSGGPVTQESAKPTRQRGSRAGRAGDSPAPDQAVQQPQQQPHQQQPADPPPPRPQPARQPEERRAAAKEEPPRRDKNGGVVEKVKTGVDGVKEGVSKIKGLFRKKP